jgi:hypothetical protein
MSVKGTVLYHVAGSAGDLVSAAWTMNPAILSATRVSGINTSGRTEVTWDHDFLTLFPKQDHRHWYTRDWSQDVEKLSLLPGEFFLNVTDYNQARLIKDYHGDAVTLVGVTYSSENWMFVLDAFCNKVLDAENYLTRDDIGENFLQVVAKTPSERDHYIELGKNKKLGAWYREQALAGGVSFPPKISKGHYDVSIDLSLILDTTRFIRALSAIIDIYDTDKFRQLYQSWQRYNITSQEYDYEQN